MLVFQWLAEHFQRRPIEFGKLVEKENSMMREANFAGRGNRAAADEPRIADRMVGGAEGTLGEQRLPGRNAAQGAIDASGFDRFLRGERGEDRRHSLGEHGLAGTWRADHQQVVCSSGGNGNRALGHLLPAHVAEVDIVVVELREELIELRWGGLDLQLSREESGRFGEAADTDHLDPLHHRRFARIFGRHHQPPQSLFLGRHRHGEGTFHRPHLPFERELAHHRILSEEIGRDLTAAGQHAERDWQIEAGRLLRHFGGCEIDHHPIARADEPAIHHRPLNSMDRLFHRRFGEPDEDGFGEGSRGDIDFDLHRQGVDSIEGVSFELREHVVLRGPLLWVE